MNDYVTISQAAEIINVSRSYVYKLIEQGKLAAEKRPIHGSIRIKREDAVKMRDELAYRPAKS